MEADSKHRASIPNPALQPLSKLVGEWETTGTHPYLPGMVLHGRASFNWIEGGAFLVMHTENDEGKIPGGVAIFGSDDATKECSTLTSERFHASMRFRSGIIS